MPLLNMLRSIIHALSGGMLCKESYDIRAHLTLLKGRILEYQELVPERTDIFYEAQESKVWHTKGWYHKTEDNDEVGPFPTRDEALIELGKYAAQLHRSYDCDEVALQKRDDMSEEIRHIDRALNKWIRENTIEFTIGIPTCGTERYVKVRNLSDYIGQLLDSDGYKTECARLDRTAISKVVQQEIDSIGHIPNMVIGMSDMKRAQETYDRAMIQGRPLMCKEGCGNRLYYVPSILKRICRKCRVDYSNWQPSLDLR